jgi:hypothetical protein
MSKRSGLHLKFPFLLGFAWCWAALSLVNAPAAEIRLKAQLVWATDADKPNDPSLKDLPPKLTEKLKKILRWKNYFEVNKQKFSLPAPGASMKLAMSPKCTVEVKRTDDANMEVKLFGEGKLVKTVRQPIKPLQQGEFSVIGGDDKQAYNTAWLVVFSSAEP